MRFSLVSTVIVPALLALAPTSHADTVYTYTGQDFATVGSFNPGQPSPFSTSDFDSGSFTTATPLAANLKDVTVAPSAFSFHDADGNVAINEGNAEANKKFLISTDGSGNVVDWSILVLISSGQSSLELIGGPEYSGFDGDVTSDLAGFGENNVSGAFTTGSSAATPEPASIALLGTGLLGVTGVLRKRFA